MKTLNTFIMVAVSLFMALSINAQEANDEEVVIKRVDKEAFKEAVESGEYLTLDVRTTDEYMDGHIERAKCLDVTDGNFESNIEKLGLKKSKKYLVYCQSGGRSSIALEKMREMGFTHVLELEGGYQNWTE
ncbi:MAG: rhodanese-like domain-containing protein [Brumimicrobium sp.]